MGRGLGAPLGAGDAPGVEGPLTRSWSTPSLHTRTGTASETSSDSGLGAGLGTSPGDSDPPMPWRSDLTPGWGFPLAESPGGGVTYLGTETVVLTIDDAFDRAIELPEVTPPSVAATPTTTTTNSKQHDRPVPAVPAPDYVGAGAADPDGPAVLPAHVVGRRGGRLMVAGSTYRGSRSDSSFQNMHVSGLH